MIEVSVHDVLLRAPKAGDAKWLAHGKDYKHGLMRVILLKERSGDRLYPIWVGAAEGDYIAMLLEKLSSVRPTPYDLTVQLLDFGAMKIDRVAVTALRNNLYYATMSVWSPGGSREMDARPSDAISIALLTGAPIFVAPEAFKETEIENPTRAVPKLEEANNESVAKGLLPPSSPIQRSWSGVRSDRSHAIIPSG